MKKLLVVISFLHSLNISADIDTTKVYSSIKDVTVFFSGAEVIREATISLSKGKHLLVFDRLPEVINKQSIQVEGLSSATILSVKHDVKNNSSILKSEKIKLIQDQIHELQIDVKRIKGRMGVLQTEEDILLQNSNFSGKEKGVEIEELKSAAKYYRERLNSIRNEMIDLGLRVNEIKEEIDSQYKKINQLLAKEKQTYSQILVAIEVNDPVKEILQLSYYVPTAGWTPTYDFRVKDVNEPLSIIYNANVYQTSGENWEKVNITLSSNDPSLSGHKPELAKWILGEHPTLLNEPKVSPQTQLISPGGVSEIRGVVRSSETKEAVPFANVSLFKDDEQFIGTTTNFDGAYTLKPINAGSYSLEVSYVGYQTKRIKGVNVSDGNITVQNVEIQEGVSLQEVEVIEYNKPLFDLGNTSSETTTYQRRETSQVVNMRGGRSNSNVSFIDGVKNLKSKNLIDNSMNENTLSLEYEIKIPYSIPSDGKDYHLKIKETKTEVNYEYFILPRVDKDAFLVAHLTDWESLNLLSGKSSLYYQGKYTGESYIDVNQAEDTLQISLGREKNIFVSRDRNKKINDKQFYSNDIKETVAWDIVIKNNKNYSVNITVEDQFPVSNRKSIDVDLINSDQANVDEKNGFLKWSFELPKGEKKEINFSYEAKYPRNMNVKFY